MAKDKDKKGDKGFCNEDASPKGCIQGRSHEERNVSTHWETLSEAGLGEASHTSEGSTLTSAATGALKARQKIHSRDFYQTALPSQEVAGKLFAPSRGWLLRLRLRGLDPRERTEIDCYEDTLRGLV